MNQFGENLLRMNLNQISHIVVEELFQWPIQGLIQINLNCNHILILWLLKFIFSNLNFNSIKSGHLYFSFITFRSCKHLDNKHTVFGKVVGGLETLAAIEKIETDNKDRPIEDIIILKTQVFVDPYQEADDLLTKEREEAKRAEEEKNKKETKKEAPPLKVYRSGVGKYINLEEHSK